MKGSMRGVWPWILALALVVLTALALFGINKVRRDMAGQLSREFERDIRDRVASWEKDLFGTLTTWSEVAADNTYQGDVYQSQLRQTAPWFDALYIWSPAIQVTNQKRRTSHNGRLLFPERALLESAQAIQQIPCLSEARNLTSQPTTTVDEAVDAWRTGCRGEDPSTRMFALSEATSMYIRSQRWEDVLDILDADGIPPTVTLSEAVSRRIPPFRATVLALQRAQALSALGRDDEAAALNFKTGMEIAALDAPDAETLLEILKYPLIPWVEAHGSAPRTEMLRKASTRATHRVFGYREVRDNLLPRLVPLVPEGPRLVRDQYGDKPFLLFTHWARGGGIGVAMQLDEEMLLDNFLSYMGRFREHLVITDVTGRKYVAGARRGGSVAVAVPFTRTLTHLRVGMRVGPLQAQLRRLDREWMAGTFLLVCVLLVALGALTAVVQTSRTQRLLLVRQKEFATRVTHELKTPLAGIKVMAENLELGTYGSDRQRASMARSIVREADNLTHRVNEILAVTKERVLRQPEPFDPEEPLFEVIDQWGPRMAVADVQLTADLQPTDEVMGDPEAFRDAVACLVDNALKYSRDDNESRVELNCEQVGDRILVSVTDNGLGVPADMRDAIFERFVRVEGDNRGKSGGHGLGLAQVVEIARAHGGTVRCEEGIDGGAKFVLEVPAVS